MSFLHKNSSDFKKYVIKKGYKLTYVMMWLETTRMGGRNSCHRLVVVVTPKVVHESLRHNLYVLYV